MAPTFLVRDRRRLSAALVAVTVFASAGCDVTKTETPLSPLIAGPIAGVTISQGRGLEPSANQRIEDRQQPISLLIENPSSNSPRPFKLRVQVSTSNTFAGLAHEKVGLEPGTNGQTRYQIPERLPYGRVYYWRSRAEDGANTGDWSATASFEILEPVVIGRPTPGSPANNERLTSRTPTLSAANGVSSGPHGALFYFFQISTDQTFVSVLASGETLQSPGGTTTYPVPLTLLYDTTYYWRVRISDGRDTGDWSATAVFRTPLAPVVVVPPPSSGGGGNCAVGGGDNIVTCNRNRYSGQMSTDQIVAFLEQTARDLTTAGINGAPFGLLEKTSGHQCNGFSCDILCSGQGSSQRQWDVLSDAEGSQNPVFNELTGPKIARNCVIR